MEIEVIAAVEWELALVSEKIAAWDQNCGFLNCTCPTQGMRYAARVCRLLTLESKKTEFCQIWHPTPQLSLASLNNSGRIRFLFLPKVCRKKLPCFLQYFQDNCWIFYFIYLEKSAFYQNVITVKWPLALHTAIESKNVVTRSHSLRHYHI